MRRKLQKVLEYLTRKMRDAEKKVNIANLLTAKQKGGKQLAVKDVALQAEIALIDPADREYYLRLELRARRMCILGELMIYAEDWKDYMQQVNDWRLHKDAAEYLYE